MQSKLLILITILILPAIILIAPVSAQEDTQESQDEYTLEEDVIEEPNYAEGVIKSIDAKLIDEGGLERLNSIIDIEITKDDETRLVSVEINDFSDKPQIKYEVGDKVIVDRVVTPDDQEIFYITGFPRTNQMLLLAIIFVALTVVVARSKGVFSLLGLGFSFFVIFKFLLPKILDGHDPLLIAIIAACFMIPVNFYISHGLNRKTTFAVISTIITLIVTGLLSIYFVDAAHLTGFTSDEAGFLSVFTGGLVNIRDLLLAGIIIGALGILDDITVSQSSIAYQLKSASPEISFKELFNRTLEVGRDHIASLVNTLILVYTSAALPLLLLFLINTDTSFKDTINKEIIAEEVIRTLLTSIGLILAIPISTFLSCYFYNRMPKESFKKASKDTHSHLDHTH